MPRRRPKRCWLFPAISAWATPRASGCRASRCSGATAEDETRADRLAGRWAAEHPKRYAAARFAVGTIDQALLGTLAVKHAHLRAACLIRHLLVIDEVHASDDFMTELIERLLVLYRAAGGHVLLMSATVGAGARVRLVTGAKSPPSFEDAVVAPYPLITSNVAAPIPVKPTGSPKSVQIEPAPLMDQPEAVAALAVEAVGQGARVLILRNTVTAAIQAQEAIEAKLGPDHPALFRVADVVTLHHGRFAAEDRKLLDEAIEGRFGRNAPPDAALAIGTQTLEQSLDIDADLLITDLCPIDILLQRIGRLHRHADRKDRPDGFGEARCIVLHPASPDLSSFLKHGRHGIGRDRAYRNVLAIEAARRLIEGAPHWTIPDDNRRLVEEGTHPHKLDAIAESMPVAWQNAWAASKGASMAERGMAKDAAIDFDKPFDKIDWPPAAEKIATRLGARDWLLRLDGPFTSAFGEVLTHLRIPDWMKPKGALDDEPVLEVVGDDQLRWDDVRYRYDRLGLWKE
ncbi:MAG: CRISPR-associated helicase Cas3' [Alphaproteobacteria bacterium]